MRNPLLLAVLLWFAAFGNATAQKGSQTVDTFVRNNEKYIVNSAFTDSFSRAGETFYVRHVVVPEMADTLRGNGKIYVVVLVLATIFAGIIAFLIYLERKIKRLEKN